MNRLIAGLSILVASQCFAGKRCATALVYSADLVEMHSSLKKTNSKLKIRYSKFDMTGNQLTEDDFMAIIMDRSSSSAYSKLLKKLSSRLILENWDFQQANSKFCNSLNKNGLRDQDIELYRKLAEEGDFPIKRSFLSVSAKNIGKKIQAYTIQNGKLGHTTFSIDN